MSGDQSSPAAVSAVRRRLRSSFERGVKLAAERSFDYAHEMFGQCVAQDPANVAYVEAMLVNLGHKFRKKRPRHVLAWSGGPLGKAVKRQDWTQALRLGIERLASDPWDVHALRAMATVCAALHDSEAELVYLKQALDAAPTDADVIRHCARTLARVGQVDQAIACWHRVETLAPGDKEATRMVFELNERKLRLTIASRNSAATSSPATTPAAGTERATDADSVKGASEPVKEVILIIVHEYHLLDWLLAQRRGEPSMAPGTVSMRGHVQDLLKRWTWWQLILQAVIPVVLCLGVWAAIRSRRRG